MCVISLVRDVRRVAMCQTHADEDSNVSHWSDMLHTYIHAHIYNHSAVKSTFCCGVCSSSLAMKMR